jgi:hypothetical protein
MGSKLRKTAKKPSSSKKSTSSKTPIKSKNLPPPKSSSKAKRSPPRPPVKTKKTTSNSVVKPNNSVNSKSAFKKSVTTVKNNHLIQQKGSEKKSSTQHHPISSKSTHPKQIGIKPANSLESIQEKGKKRNYSEIDKDLLGLITESNHLFIQEIEEKLLLNADDVKKALKRLEQKGKITTHNEMSEGKWKIEAIIIDNFGLETQVKKKTTAPTVTALIWDTDDIPCYLCPNVKKCRAGQEELNPQKCIELSKWLEARLNKVEYVNPYRNQVKDIK